MAPPKFPQTSTRSSISAYPPPPSLSSLIKSTSFWGGEDFIARLKCYVHILRSNLRRFCFFPIVICNSHSPFLAHGKPRPLSSPPASALSPNPYSHRSSVLHRSLGAMSSNAHRPPESGWLCNSPSRRHVMQLRIFAHLLAKLIVTHSPESVKSLVDGNGDIDWGNWRRWEEMGGDWRV
ncbi:hypothetical protein C8R42DRAFT_729978 [Lentinula raphanica]|nr:hypothetical protein C8R42DRAFT_729978 [Lentinula raphanica]